MRVACFAYAGQRLVQRKPRVSLETTTRIVNFLRDIGLVVEARPLAPDNFLPGIRVAHGELLYDPAQLRHPGDLLHEAGHLAVVPSEERAGMDGEVVANPGLEMAAIAWSYAACRHLGMDCRVVFHADGYKGGAEALVENFSQGYYIGVPILTWRGLTDAPHPDAAGSATTYPLMRAWLAA